ncbi:MAG: DUF736 family protein [Acidiphilium sp.]|nr:DUF736 family protein [Acidiphilium sp.]
MGVFWNDERDKTMIIGRFCQQGGAYSGDLRTITLKLDIVIQPVTNRVVDVGPTHLIFAGTFLVGSGFAKQADDGSRYLTLRLDDPLFPVPIDATLRETDGGEWIAEWYRPGSAKYSKVA